MPSDDDDDDEEDEYQPTGMEAKMLAGMGRTSMRNDALRGVVRGAGDWLDKYTLIIS